MDIRTVYLRTIFDPELFPLTIQKTLEKCQALKKEYDFDSIAFCGISGAAMAFVIAHQMNLPLVCVRKKGESSHYVSQGFTNGRLCEGNIGTRKYIIVDDVISSGNTVNYIMDSIEKDCDNAKCMAMVMYAAHGENSTYTRLNQTWDVFHTRPDN